MKQQLVLFLHGRVSSVYMGTSSSHEVTVFRESRHVRGIQRDVLPPIEINLGNSRRSATAMKAPDFHESTRRRRLMGLPRKLPSMEVTHPYFVGWK